MQNDTYIHISIWHMQHIKNTEEAEKTTLPGGCQQAVMMEHRQKCGLKQQTQPLIEVSCWASHYEGTHNSQDPDHTSLSFVNIRKILCSKCSCMCGCVIVLRERGDIYPTRTGQSQPLRWSQTIKKTLSLEHKILPETDANQETLKIRG